MKARFAAVALALALLAAGCDSSANDAGGPTGDALGPPQAARETGDPCSGAPNPGSRTVEFLSNNHPRTAWIHLPPAPAGEQLPLVVAFHFAGGTGREMEAAVGLSALGRPRGLRGALSQRGLAEPLLGAAPRATAATTSRSPTT